jgi:antitoxin VapB
VSLNIKNQRVHDLAREAARVTGKSQTGAILEALERLLAAYDADPAEVRVRAKLDLVTTLVAEYAADPGDEERALRRVEDLYDESTGLPR